MSTNYLSDSLNSREYRVSITILGNGGRSNRGQQFEFANYFRCLVSLFNMLSNGQYSGIKFNSHFKLTRQFRLFSRLLDRSNMQKVNSFNSILTVHVSHSLSTKSKSMHSTHLFHRMFAAVLHFSFSTVSFPLNESASASQCTI